MSLQIPSRRFSFVPFLTLLLFPVMLSAQGSDWYWAYPFPNSNRLNGVAAIDSLHLVAVGDGGTVMTSIDGGLTWSGRYRATGGKPGEDLYSVAVLDDTTWLAAGKDAEGYGILYRSTTGGKSWKSVYTYGGVIREVVTDRSKRLALAVGDNGLAIRSLDGVNWTNLTLPFRTDFYGAAIEGNYQAIVGNGGTILISNNGGSQFNDRTDRSTSARYPVYDVTFVREGYMIAVGYNEIYVNSNDAFTTGRRTFSGADFRSVSRDNDYGIYAFTESSIYRAPPEDTWGFDQLHSSRFGITNSLYTRKGIVLVGQGGDIFFKPNGAGAWNPVSSSQKRNITWLAPVKGKLRAFGTAGQILEREGESAWNALDPIPGKNSVTGGSFADANIGYLLSGKLPLRTTDGGLTWKEDSMIPDGVDLDFLDSRFGLMMSLQGAPCITTDGGITWQRRPAGLANYPTVGRCFTQNIFCVGGPNVCYYTEDGGENWEAGRVDGVTHHDEPRFNGVFRAISRQSGLKAVAVGDSGLILRTENGGKDWTRIRIEGMHEHLTGVVFRDDLDGVILGTNGMVLHTIDGGKRWSYEYSPATVTLRTAYPVDGSEKWIVAGDNGTILNVTFTESITSVATRTDERGFSLHVRPNPVGTTGRLIMEPSRPGLYSIRLIDPLGREIRTLFEGAVGKDRLSIPFSREDLSAGLYFVRAVQDGEEGSGSTIPLIVK